MGPQGQLGKTAGAVGSTQLNPLTPMGFSQETIMRLDLNLPKTYVSIHLQQEALRPFLFHCARSGQDSV